MKYSKYSLLLSSAFLVVLASSSNLPVIGSGVTQEMLAKPESDRAVVFTNSTTTKQIARRRSRRRLIFNRINVRAPYPRRARNGGLRSSSCKQQDNIIALLPADQKATELNKSSKQLTDITHLTADPYPTVLFSLPPNSPTIGRFYLSVAGETENSQKLVYFRDIQLPNATDKSQNGVVILNLSDLAKTKNLPELEIGKSYIWKIKFICGSTFAKIDQKSPEISGWMKRIDANTSLKSQLGSSDINNQDLKDTDVIEDQLNQVETKDYPSVYVENGIWYSAVSSLAQLRKNNPEDLELKSDWKALLDSVKLEEISEKPILGSATPISNMGD